MVPKKYRIRKGYRTKGVAAEVVERCLTDIDQANGGITAEAVLDSARPKEALLHPVFEWRDNVAAEEYRLHQSRNLIRCVEVIEEDAKGVQYATPAIVYVPGIQGDAGMYRPISQIVNQPDQFALALMALNRKLQDATESVRALERAGQNGAVDGERMARISVAVRALETASAAIAFH